METVLLVITLISVATAVVALASRAASGATNASAPKLASPRSRTPRRHTGRPTAAGRRSPESGSGHPNPRSGIRDSGFGISAARDARD